jgi:hypothetical protein
MIDIIVFLKYIKLKKKYSVIQEKWFSDGNNSCLCGMEIKTIIDGYFINYIAAIKVIVLIVSIRMMLLISFYCKVICDAISNNGPQEGNIYNFVLVFVSSILVIVVCNFSIQYVEIVKCKLLIKCFQRKPQENK